MLTTCNGVVAVLVRVAAIPSSGYSSGRGELGFDQRVLDQRVLGTIPPLPRPSGLGGGLASDVDFSHSVRSGDGERERVYEETGERKAYRHER